MTNLEDAYLRANIHLADTLAEALISVNEQENKPTYEVDPGGRAEETAKKLAAQRKKKRVDLGGQSVSDRAARQARRDTAEAMRPHGM